MCQICAQAALTGPHPSAPAVAPLPWLTPEEVADYLTVGFWADFIGRPGPFAFEPGTDRALSVDLSGLTGPGRDLARAALDAWGAVTGISFSEATPDADITFDDEEPGGFGGPSRLRGQTIERAEVNVDKALIDRFGAEIGGRAYFYFLHEIGHALGLGHPGPYNADATFSADATFANDSWQMSAMSYFPQDAPPGLDASHAIPLTPQVADTVAMARLYGPVETERADTRYGEDSTAKGPLGMFLSAPSPTAQTIVDTGGIDWIDLSGDPSGVRLDLAPGATSDILGLRGNLTIAPGSVIENARTGSGADRVTGNGASNIIEGGAGSDTLSGGAGNDTLNGGAGDDVLEGGPGTDILIGGPGADVARFDGSLHAHELRVQPDGGWLVGPSGADKLVDVEFAQFDSGQAWFADGSQVRLGELTQAGRLAPEELLTFSEMYVAYFDRAPDAPGFHFWASVLARGTPLEEIAEIFFEQDETQALYPPGGSNAALIDAAYLNLFERAPDPGGRAWWLDQLDRGEVSRGEFMLELIRGAKANSTAEADQRTVEDKGAIGLSYAAIHGLTDVEGAHDVMDLYVRSAPDASLAAARDRIDTLADAAQDAFAIRLVGVMDDPLA
ncbi:M10 family metallopeptidase C-terminal domain-containing protein [Rhodovulum sp. 12E13]|uniref:M10 family metallopeptidase C-terminal domain-containing protein n=1 Tax=Rhodovulum sp. 12E13 TaxID=2203891 RepID=UPI0026A7A6B2|nr:M10 family metallopeptidase C-terminal domain-containing protein [Rhodovulum sp. 12E13]